MVQIIGSGISNSENTVLVTDAQELFVRHPGSIQTFGNIGSVLITNDPVPVSGLMRIGSGTNIVKVNDYGQMHVVLMGKVDTNNSTSTPLGIGGSFIGSSTNILDFGFIFVTTFSDVVSATDGLSAQQSSDGINWDNTDNYTVPANKGKTYSFQPGAKFFRITYNNGATGQTDFRLQTILKKTSSLASSHRVQDAIVDEDDAELVKSVITGKNPGGNFINFSATNGGNFKISLEEFESSFFNTNPFPIIGSVLSTQGTNPWLVLGSTRVVQDSTLRQISAGSVNINNFIDLGSSRIITAGSFVLTNIGSVYNIEVNPIATILNNPAMKYEYIISGTATGITGSEIGSITQFIGAGSFVQVLTYSNDLITNIGSWS